MSKLNLNKNVIQECRMDAKVIATDIQKFIDLNTTVSVERSVLRLLGVDGVNDFNVPLVNIVVDQIQSRGNLSKGVSHYMSYAVYDLDKSPQEIAELVTKRKLDLSVYKDREKSPYIELLTPHFERILRRIEEMTKMRNDFLMKVEHKSTPAKYVIVATGNIYEDIKQAVSAAKKGADIIAVIRSTGQSLLDFVPYGATTEGFGGTSRYDVE